MRLLVIAAWFLGAALVAADLPIHCLRSQVAGTWEFKVGAAESSTPDLCGYRQPDKSKHHLDGSYTYRLPASAQSVDFTLGLPSTVSAGAGFGNGTWTMVYDEGFMITLADAEFFAFHAYKAKKGTILSNIKPENYISFCDKTLIGWYRKGAKFGCWQGALKTPLHPNVRISAAGKNAAEVDFAVVAPDAAKPAVAKPSLGALFPALIDASHTAQSSAASSLASRALDDLFNPNYAAIEAVNRDPSSTYSAKPFAPFLAKTNRDMLGLVGGRGHAKTPLPRSAPSSPVSSQDIERYASFLQLEESLFSSAAAAAEADAAETEADAFSDAPVFLEASVDVSEQSADSALDAADAQLLSLHETDSQRAKALARRAAVRAAAANATSSPSAASLPTVGGQKTCEYGLPCALDWRNHQGHNWLSSVRNQGSCGSCYAMAFTAALEARVRIKKNQPTRHRYSPQHALACSSYNQGCDGGFPELVGLHVQHFGAVSEKCFPYGAHDGFCQQSCKEQPEYPITGTRYVGGYYGNTSEESMMKEIAAGGPVVVAFESPHGLFSYHGGIFTGPKPRAEDQGVPGLALWQHTNHAIVAVGWGHTMVNGVREKYWIMRNTWGKHWGEDGYFRIRRGTDECGIESMAVTFDVKDKF